MINAEVAERIKKLIALSGSSNVNEAASARAKADELLKKHGVEEQEVVQFKIAGYFAWVRTLKGRPVCEKLHPDAMPYFAERKKMRKMVVLREFPLSAREFKLCLDDLATIYPCPEHVDA